MKPQGFFKFRPVHPGEEGDVGHGCLTADQAQQGQAKNGLKGMTNSPGPPGIRHLFQALEQRFRSTHIHTLPSPASLYLITFIHQLCNRPGWVADVLDIQVNDIVYDPTCGTGGFLVSAFDSVKRRASPEQVARFKEHGVFGIEQDDGVAALAVVNMIFRGDGKNNIQEGNCFAKHLTFHSEKGVSTAKYIAEPTESQAVTKVMMNPPFALKRSDEKEFRFIDQALAQLEHGGALFSVLPYSVMVKPGQYKAWRRDSLLPNNTLLAVVTFPPDVFYPVGVTTVGVFVRKGIPHPREQNVLWVRALTDGLLKRKRKRLPNSRTTNELEDVHNLVRAFIHDPTFPVETVDQFQRATPIDFTDDRVELVPEAYLTQAFPPEKDIRDALQESIRNSFAYLVKIDRASKAKVAGDLPESLPLRQGGSWRQFLADQVFTIERGHFHSIADLDPGPYITISRIGTDNGLVGFTSFQMAHMNGLLARSQFLP